MAVVEAIATTYLEADAAGITFSSIPATYEHLQLRCSFRTDGTNRSDVTMTFNSDTGAGQYSSHRIIAYGGTATGGGWGSLTGMLGVSASAGDAYATDYSSVIVDVLDYANTNKNTTCKMFSAAKTSANFDIFVTSGLWDDTDAVHTITLDGSYDLRRGSSVTLYGWNSA